MKALRAQRRESLVHEIVALKSYRDQLRATLAGIDAEIAAKGGDRVRLVQTGAENYWYGWSPFTWILTPVVTDVVVEFEPSKEELDKAKRDNAALVRRQRRRMQADNSHVIPDRR